MNDLIILRKVLIMLGPIGGLIAFLGGFYALYAEIPRYGILPLIIYLSVFALIGLLCWRIFGPIFESQKIMKEGLTGEATILDIKETGITFNKIYFIVKLKLEVRLPGQQPYQTEITSMISRLRAAMFFPGMTTAIKYDKHNPKKIVLAGAF